MAMEKFRIGSLVQDDNGKDEKIVFVDTLNNRVCVETEDKKGWKLSENMDAINTSGLDKILDPNKIYWWVWEHQVKKITDIPLDDAAKLAAAKKETEAAEVARQIAVAEAEAIKRAAVDADVKAKATLKAAEEKAATAKANEKKAIEKANFLAKEKELLAAETAAAIAAVTASVKALSEKKLKKKFEVGDWIQVARSDNLPTEWLRDQAYQVIDYDGAQIIIRVPAGGWKKSASDHFIIDTSLIKNPLYWSPPFLGDLGAATPSAKRAGIVRDFNVDNQVVSLMDTAVPASFSKAEKERACFIIEGKGLGIVNIVDVVSKKMFSVRFDQVKSLLGLVDVNFNESQKESKEIMANEDGGVVATFKKDSVAAGYRVAGRKLSKVAQQGLVLLFKSQGMKSKEIKSLMNLAETDMGRAGIAHLIGQALPRIPGLKDNPRVLRLAEELRVESMSDGMEMTLDGLLGGLSAQFLPQIQAIISELPAEETVAPPVKQRIEAKGDNKAAEEEAEAEEEVHHHTKKHARAA